MFALPAWVFCGVRASEGRPSRIRFKEEGESAKTTDRTELQKLLKYCRTNRGRIHFVVVYNLTRFAREKYDHFALRAHLKSLGISLRSATEPIDDTSTGQLMEGVLAAFAQFDNDVRSERTRAGMRAALELGRRTFPAPLGYLNTPKWSGKSLVPDPERATLVKQIFEDYASGGAELGNGGFAFGAGITPFFMHPLRTAVHATACPSRSRRVSPPTR